MGNSAVVCGVFSAILSNYHTFELRPDKKVRARAVLPTFEHLNLEMTKCIVHRQRQSEQLQKLHSPGPWGIVV